MRERADSVFVVKAWSHGCGCCYRLESWPCCGTNTSPKLSAMGEMLVIRRTLAFERSNEALSNMVSLESLSAVSVGIEKWGEGKDNHVGLPVGYPTLLMVDDSECGQLRIPGPAASSTYTWVSV